MKGTSMNDSDRALSDLRRRLGVKPEGIGDVTFTRTDGRQVFVADVRFDSIGVDHGQTPLGVVTLTKEDETIVHLPFIESWTVEF
jgi:hypothetical protein